MPIPTAARRMAVGLAVAAALAARAAADPPADPFPPTPLEVVTSPLAATPAAAAAVPLADHPADGPPLPGSLTDQVLRDHAARDTFRLVTWRDVVWTAFPTTLLWEPPLANRREPRFAVEPTTRDNYRSDWTLDTSIGNTLGLYRAEPLGTDLRVQFDLFAVVHSRLSPDDLIAADYRFGFPLTFQRGPWHGKLGYEHTSAHLADEAVVNGRLRPTRYTVDELVVAGGRWLGDCLRVYGQLGFAVYQDLPTGFDRVRYDVGAEAYYRAPTGWAGTPYAACDLELRPEQDLEANLSVQLGWLWRNPELRLSQYRVWVGYYSGKSAFGQFFDTRENFASVGMAADY